MRTVKIWLLGLLLASPAAFPLSGNLVATDNVKAHLVSEVSAIAPGQSFWVALEFNIRDGWHTYWRNPGDSGQATTLKWQLPPGFTAGDIVWTTPHRFEIPPLVNYGYAKHAVHMVNITAPRDLKAGAPIVLSAKASWLVCSDVCIPEDADLQLKVPVSPAPGAVDPADAALFTAARSELPSAQFAATTARLQGDQLVIALGKEWGATLPQIKSLAFFPYDEGGIEYAAPQTLTRNQDAVELAMKLGYQPPKAGSVRGVLLATEQSGNDTVTVPMEIAANLAGTGGSEAKGSPRFAPAPAGAPAPAAEKTTASLPVLLVFAVLGGLILNLMPCVFPVLSIKAIGLVEQAKKHPAAVRTKGLVFAAGVISSMLCLAAVLLTLRAGGEQIGWGFQLQSPLFVTLLMYLLLAVGLNLSGVFEVGGGLAGVGDGLTQGDSYRASFFTGVLTTLVATPCTAPYMAFAVGAALTQPPVYALCIFAALGFGLALPYLLLSFAPWTRRALPKPGAWMDTLKQVFAFPIYASAAWLLWVLAGQTSSFGLGAALAGAILIAFAAWAYQKSKSSAAGGRVAALVTATVAVLLAILLPVRFADVAAAASSASAHGAQAADGWQRYDAAQVAKLNAAGRPLLVNFTASWCLTCLVNERNAFTDSAVQEVFRSKGVTLMKGDWTNRDPAITQALASFGRAGVPLYVVYNSKPGSTEPVILPQLLTASVVQSAFADTPSHGSTP
ncbi:MAG TPA: protein-disulfide reductase DsbD domain-containing protein [Steroidobacteraceae bacterium]|nr:protein-disulfide reductase DsbD domain-containing protein [Steroidobacteraceae bacterium]